MSKAHLTAGFVFAWLLCAPIVLMASVPCFMNELKEGTLCQIDAIVCRKWDVYNHYGKYKGTDYVLSDAKGNVIHCTTKSTVAHCFMGTLKEGCVYTFKDFYVLPNLKEYRVIRHSSYMLELHGRSAIRRHESVAAGFSRYMFTLTDIGDVKFDVNDTTLIEVVGYVVDVGPIVPRIAVKGNKLKKPSQTLDFYLVGSRGHKIRVTLWGGLADEFLQRRPPNSQMYAVILVGMSVRTYTGTFLSSTSNTLLYDSAEIPQLSEFRKGKVQTGVVDVPPAHVTLLQLSQWCKGKKKATNFHCTLKITAVDTTAPWYYFACSSGRCMKGVTRRNGGFYCESCVSRVEFPKTRFKLRLTVEDATHSAALTLFDAAAEALLCTSVDTLLSGHDEDAAGGMPPDVMLNLVDTWHTFQIPSQSYYPHGGEGYTCVGVAPVAVLNTDAAPRGSNDVSGSRVGDSQSIGHQADGVLSPNGKSRGSGGTTGDKAGDSHATGQQDGGSSSASAVGGTSPRGYLTKMPIS